MVWYLSMETTLPFICVWSFNTNGWKFKCHNLMWWIPCFFVTCYCVASHVPQFWKTNGCIMCLLEILHQCQFLCPWWSSVPYDWWWRHCRSCMDGYRTMDRLCSALQCSLLLVRTSILWCKSSHKVSYIQYLVVHGVTMKFTEWFYFVT
jgi:hypothetical protein